MALLVSGIMPAPSPAETSPRGVKRSRSPERSGNGQAEGDQDDGMCAPGGLPAAFCAVAEQVSRFSPYPSNHHLRAP